MGVGQPRLPGASGTGCGGGQWDGCFCRVPSWAPPAAEGGGRDEGGCSASSLQSWAGKGAEQPGCWVSPACSRVQVQTPSKIPPNLKQSLDPQFLHPSKGQCALQLLWCFGTYAPQDKQRGAAEIPSLGGFSVAAALLHQPGSGDLSPVTARLGPDPGPAAQPCRPIAPPMAAPKKRGKKACAASHSPAILSRERAMHPWLAPEQPPLFGNKLIIHELGQRESQY